MSLDDGFTPARNGRKVIAHCVVSATVPLHNKSAAMQNKAEPKPSVTLVGDSSVRGQGNVFCREKNRRRYRCYPGRKIEDVSERVDYLVETLRTTRCW